MDDVDLAACPGTPILVAIVGSRAYGTDHADSDTDLRGVFSCPADHLLSLRPPAETYDRREPDVTLHELRKFCKLAASANPSVMEVLWADPYICTPAGTLLRVHRDLFLSRRALNTYGGYARQQLTKAARGTGGSRGQKHHTREKFALHLYRLMECGIHLMESGDLHLRVDDPDALRTRARQPLDVIERDFVVLDGRLRDAMRDSPLPPEPDWVGIDRLMMSVRAAARASVVSD